VQNDQTISKSNFDPKKKTKIIIHGFIDTPLSNWVKVIMQFKLSLQNNNIYFLEKTQFIFDYFGIILRPVGKLMNISVLPESLTA
jgi:hypothetical protein